MPTFTFTSPDGKTYSVDGPPGSTKDQAFQILQRRIGGASTSAPPPRDTSWGGGKPDLGAIADAGGEGVPNPNTLAALAMGAGGGSVLGGLQLAGVKPPGFLTSLQKSGEKDPSGVGEFFGGFYNPLYHLPIPGISEAGVLKKIAIPAIEETGKLGKLIAGTTRGTLGGLLTPLPENDSNAVIDKTTQGVIGGLSGFAPSFLGTAIQGGLSRFARRIEQMNREAYDEVLSSLGLKASNKFGQPALAELRKTIGDKLDTAQSQLSLNVAGNNAFTADLGQVWTAAHDNPETGKIFDRLFNKNIGQLLGAKPVLSGPEVAKAISNLRTDIDAITDQERPSENEWSAVNRLRDAIHVINDHSQGPAEAKKLLTDANYAYAKYIKVRQASSSALGGSIASPASLASAVQQPQGSRFALDTSKLRKIAEDAHEEAYSIGARAMRSMGALFTHHLGAPWAASHTVAHVAVPEDPSLLRISRAVQTPHPFRVPLGEAVRSTAGPTGAAAAGTLNQPTNGASP